MNLCGFEASEDLHKDEFPGMSIDDVTGNVLKQKDIHGGSELEMQAIKEMQFCDRVAKATG